MRKIIESPNVSEGNEKRILRVCLLGEETFFRISEKIDIDCFFKRYHQAIFEVYKKLMSDGIKLLKENIEPKLSHDLRALKVFQDIYDSDKVGEEEIDIIIAILIDKKDRRKLIEIDMWLKKNLETKESSSIIFNRLNEKLIKFGDNISSDQEHISSILIREIPDINDIKEVKKNILGVTTGLSKLDKLTYGYETGQLIIVAANTSEGKSTLVLQGALEVAKNNKPVAIFSLEDVKKEIVNRMLSCESEVDNFKIKFRRFKDNNDKKKFKQAYELLKELPIEIDDSVSHSPFSIFNQCRKLQYRYGDLGLIVVDYVQCITEDRERLEKVTQQFQNYTKSLGVPIVLVSQFHRGLDYRQHNWETPPKKSDLRGSGVLEEGAYKILTITSEPHQELKEGISAKTKKSIIWVIKNKNGQLGHVRCLHHLTIGKFKETDFNFSSSNEEETPNNAADNFFNNN